MHILVLAIILTSLGLLELFLAFRFMAAQLAARTTFIWQLAAITAFTLLLAVAADSFTAWTVLFSLSKAPISTQMLSILIFVNKVAILFKLISVVGLGFILICRLYIFYGWTSTLSMAHVAVFALMLAFLATAAFTSMIRLTQLKSQSFQQHYMGVNLAGSGPSLAQVQATFAKKQLSALDALLIGKFYAVAFVLELFVTISATASFLMAIGIPTGYTLASLIKSLIHQGDAVRVIIIFILTLAKTISLLSSSRNLFSYTGSITFFISALQYPLELHLFLLTSYKTSRVLVKEGLMKSLESAKSSQDGKNQDPLSQTPISSSGSTLANNETQDDFENGGYASPRDAFFQSSTRSLGLHQPSQSSAIATPLGLFPPSLAFYNLEKGGQPPPPPPLLRLDAAIISICEKYNPSNSLVLFPKKQELLQGDYQFEEPYDLDEFISQVMETDIPDAPGTPVTPSLYSNSIIAPVRKASLRASSFWI